MYIPAHLLREREREGELRVLCYKWNIHKHILFLLLVLQTEQHNGRPQGITKCCACCMQWLIKSKNGGGDRELPSPPSPSLALASCLTVFGKPNVAGVIRINNTAYLAQACINWEDLYCFTVITLKGLTWLSGRSRFLEWLFLEFWVNEAYSMEWG